MEWLLPVCVVCSFVAALNFHCPDPLVKDCLLSTMSLRIAGLLRGIIEEIPFVIEQDSVHSIQQEAVILSVSIDRKHPLDGNGILSGKPLQHPFSGLLGCVYPQR